MKLDFYWHTDTEDVNLGRVWLDVLPPVGSLVIGPGEPASVWRVVQLYMCAAEAGSKAQLDEERGRRPQLGIYMVFVEPAEGPFHAGDAEEPT